MDNQPAKKGGKIIILPPLSFSIEFDLKLEYDFFEDSLNLTFYYSPQHKKAIYHLVIIGFTTSSAVLSERKNLGLTFSRYLAMPLSHFLK